MAIGSGSDPNFNIQAPAYNQSLVYDTSQNAFINANISVTGNVTGGVNVGTGSQVFKSLIGTDLQLRSIVAGTGVTLTQNVDDITLSATGTISTVGNLGTGTEVFAQVDSGNLQLRSLTVGTGLAIANTATDISITVDTANLEASTLGGNLPAVFLTKADNLASLNSIVTARDNLDVFSKSEANTAYYRKDLDLLPDSDDVRSLGSNSARFSDIFAVEFHGLSTSAGAVNSIANHSLGGLANVNESGKIVGQSLTWNGTAWVPVTISTANLSEGVTNLFYTDARADIRAQLKIDALVDSAPGVLDTLNELAAAVGDDANFATTMTTSIAGKEPIVTAGTNAQYWRGDKTFRTLDTSAVVENANLYFTDARADARADVRIGASSVGSLSDVDLTGNGANKFLKWNGSKFAPATITEEDLSDNTTSDLAEGTNLYYTSARMNADMDTRLQSKSTDDLAEGGRLYFTNARADARIGAAGINALSDINTSGLASGQFLKYNGTAWVPASITEENLADNDTDDLAEGSTNLYFTNARADARADARVNAGFSAKSTTDLSEGTNLYYTSARANTDIDARISGSTGITSLSDVASVVASNDGDFLYYDHSTTSFKWKEDSIYFRSNADAVPLTDNTYSLGTDSIRFSDIYAVEIHGSVTTAGQVSQIGNHQLSALSDVDATAPTTGHVLKWNGSKWAPGTDSGHTTTDTLTEGSTNLYFTNARTDARVNLQTGANLDLSSKTTANLTEGANLYYTDARADTRITNALIDEDNMATNSATKLPSQQSVKAYVDAQAHYSSFNTDFDTRLTSKSTTNLSEGTNLYYTDARADARITNSVLSALSNVHNAAPTSGQVLTWDNPNSRWTPLAPAGGPANTDALTEGSTNLYFTNARADARADARISNASLGALLDVDVSGVANNSVIKWNSSSSKWEIGTDVGGGGSGVDNFLALTDTPSNFTSDAGKYLKVNSGETAIEFDTLTTADVTEGANLYYTDVRADARIVNAGSANWNTAFGWGDHSVASYLTSTGVLSSHTDVHTAVPTDGQVLKWDNANSRWAPGTDTGGTPAGYNNTNWDTAYGWGDHSAGGYLTTISGQTLTTLSDVAGVVAGDNNKILYYDHATTSFKWKVDAGGPADTDALPEGSSNLYYTDARVNTRVSALGSANWNTAFGWGDHSGAGYLTSTVDWTVDQGATNIHAGNYTDTDTIYTTFNSDFDTRLASKSTADLTEGANLYYTDARADGRIAVAILDEDNMASDSNTKVPTQQSVKAYVDAQAHYTSFNTDFDTRLASKDTGDVSEGTNLYYTDARADARIGLAGLTDLGNVTGVVAGDDGKVLYYDHGTTSFKWTTAGAPPGYNNTNWDTAYGWGDHSGAGYLTSQTSHADVLQDGDFASQGIMLRGASAGTYSILTNNSANWDTGYTHSQSGHAPANAIADITGQTFTSLSDVSGVVAGDDGKILYYDHGTTSFKWKADAGGVALTDLSVTTGSASGSGVLAYNNGTGVFTFNPADLSSYLTSIAADSINRLHIDWGSSGNQVDTDDVPEGTTNLFYTDARADARITAANLSDLTDVHIAAATDGQVLTWDNANTRWAPAASAGGGSQDVFKSIAVSGQSNVEADSTTDTLTLVGGTGIVLTTNAGTDSVTIAASGGGGSTKYEEFKINYATDGSISTISDDTAGISGVNIDSAVGGDLTVTFTGFTTPPIGFTFYGYNYAGNEYNINTLGSTGTTLRVVPGGGSSGSPTAFGSFSTLKLKVREAETGASRSFGTVTHAWIRFVMGA
jgi:hypothetical protein